MKKRLIYVMFMASGFISVKAQTVNGLVSNKDKDPVEYATIVLQTPDSVYVNSTYTDSVGRFSILADRTDYRLIVQHLMYESYEKNYSNEYELTIELTDKENVLDEIVVKAERPVVKLVNGKITYDMPLLLSGKSVSNAYESILQLPGVREQSGALMLAGASSVTVIINGQVTSMPRESLMAALKMYPANMIQSAEIMYSTPPQYHIRGAAINLVLKGDAGGDGLQGQLNTDYTQKHYANYKTGISFILPTPKLTVDFNYAYNRDQSRSSIDFYSNHLYDGLVNNIEQFNRGKSKSHDHHIRLGMDYKLSENNKLNIVYTSQITTGTDNNESSNGTFSRSDNHSENISPVQLHDVLINYTSGFGLKVGTEYTSYREYINQHFTEKTNGKEGEFRADERQEINRYRFFADQSHSLPSEWTLNYGAQYMYASDKSSQIYNSFTNNDMSGLDVSSTLKEYTTNAYVGFEKSFGQKMSLSASLTGEYYELGSFNEWTVFPAFEMTYVISSSQIMQLSFSSDKVYPEYWEMHGAVSYLNGYSEVHGNPQLKPYREYSSKLNYVLNSKYTLTAFYNYLDEYSCQLPYQATDRLKLIYKTQNLDYKQTIGVSVVVPFKPVEAINSRLNLIGFYDKVKSANFYDISFAKDKYVLYTKLDNTVNISSKPNIKMEVNGAYISNSIQGPAELTALWKLDAGLKWTFFHNMAELRLKGTDVFNSWAQPDVILKYNTQNLRMDFIPDSRAVSLSFTFKLGGYDKTYKEIDSSRFGKK